MGGWTRQAVPLSQSFESTPAVGVGSPTPPPKLPVDESVVPREEVALDAKTLEYEAVAPELLAAERR